MKIGFDYYNTLTKYPGHFFRLCYSLTMDFDNTLYVISAIGKQREGTIASSVSSLGIVMGYETELLFDSIHEVIFDNYKQSPELKLAKCKELGIEMFYDDRQDVVDLLNKNGILAFKVPKDAQH